MTLDRTLKFRASRDHEQKLSILAQLTDSNMSAVIRRLVETAQIAQAPTVQAGELGEIHGAVRRKGADRETL